MSEQELKLHVPLHSRPKIKKVLAKANQIQLRAMYFDTSDRQLAKAKVAIRLRQEGEEWIQTLKMAGHNSLSRIELNHYRPGPVLDLSLYAGTAAESVLAKLNKPLELRYETDVLRLFKKQRTRQGSVEIAFDTGFIRAGRLELPINEVEFELISGEPQAMFELGLRWLNNYDLILDMRTKSHRGDALASMMAKINQADPELQEAIECQETARFWAERKAEYPSLAKNLSATQALCRLTEECVEHMAINASYLAEVDTADVLTVASPEHVHQLRVGMRRLISYWKLFNDIAHLPELELQTSMKSFLAAFGVTRDTDVMLESIMPSLQQAGMPPITINHYTGPSATELARDKAFQVFLVKLLAWVATAPQSDPCEPNDEIIEESIDSISNAAEPSGSAVEDLNYPSNDDAISPHQSETDDISTTVVDIIPFTNPAANHPSLRKSLEKRLAKWNKSIVKHWKKNSPHDIEAYHDLRKKIKRMRYGLTVYMSLEGHANLNSYIKKLSHAQEVFGTLNDHSTALDYFHNTTATHPESWFAVGWLSAQLNRLKKEADSALKELPKKIQF